MSLFEDVILVLPVFPDGGERYGSALLSSESVVGTTSQQLWLFIYHCAAFCSYSCVFSSATAICVIPIKGPNWEANKQEQEVWLSEKAPASPVTPRGDLERIARRMPSQLELGEWLWQGRSKKGRKKGESLPPFPAGLMQRADNVCFINSSPLFSNHLLRDISKKGR